MSGLKIWLLFVMCCKAALVMKFVIAGETLGAVILGFLFFIVSAFLWSLAE